MSELGTALLSTTLGWIVALWATQALQRPLVWVPVGVMAATSLMTLSVFASVAVTGIGLCLGVGAYAVFRYVLAQFARASPRPDERQVDGETAS